MSGIVAVAQRDRRPLDAGLLDHMTTYLAAQGPDAQQRWLDGHVGLGHTLLATTVEAVHERQPCTVDGQVWITADARVDRRPRLLQALQTGDRPVTATATDAELILHAYHLWGEACVEHLLGDFAFVIWDSRRQQLFCGRDHFGVKPFYYAETGGCFLASNALNCLRTCPALRAELNDQAVADFLLFGYNQDLATTIFAEIRRLPPAHTLTWRAEEGVRMRRYWTLPVEEPIRWRQPEDYVERFRELFSLAVADRLRTQKAGALMSGGMDSTSVTAMAHTHLAESPGSNLRVYTFSSEHFGAAGDDEPHFAGLVAAKLGIAATQISVDGYELFERWERAEVQFPEPLSEPLLALTADVYRQAASHGPVILTGQGGDPALYPSRAYLWNLLREFKWGALAADVRLHLRLHGEAPPLHVRSTFLQSSTQRQRRYARLAVYPPWLNPDFAARLDLPARWQAWLQRLDLGSSRLHPTRPEAYDNLASDLWPVLFESRYAPSALRIPLEFRHPFFDVELLAFLLRVPPVPWFIDKALLRQAMRGILPEEIVVRAKKTFDFSMVDVLLRRHGLPVQADRAIAAQSLEPYVLQANLQRLARSAQRLAVADSNLLMRPLALALWRQHPAPEQYA